MMMSASNPVEDLSEERKSNLFQVGHLDSYLLSVSCSCFRNCICTIVSFERFTDRRCATAWMRRRPSGERV